MSEVSPEERGIAVAPNLTAADLEAQIVALKSQLDALPKGPSLLSRAGRRLVTLLHDKPVNTELKKLLPVLALRAVVYAGGSVEAAKLVQDGLRAVGL